jgi:hypothetical protein
MTSGHRWAFKARFRAHAFGWRGSSLASTRLKEAVREITSVAKSDRVLAAEGCVSLMERLWPALEDIDTSSGALGGVIHRTLDELIPILISAPADVKLRSSSSSMAAPGAAAARRISPLRPRCSSPPARIMSCLTSPGCRMSAAASLVLADQVRRAIAWVYDNAAHLGSDPTQLYVGGQSSGGHLAAVALTTDWPRDFGLPADIIKGGMCISGMCDLTPVRLPARNAYVAFDDATVAALSPIRHLDRLHAPLVVAYGTCETPEVPASEPRICRCGESRRKAGAAACGRELQPLRIAGDARQPVRSPGAGRARSDWPGSQSLAMTRIGLWWS